MKTSLYLLSTLLVALLCSEGRADSSQPGLFEDDNLLEISIQIDLDAVCRPREMPDCNYVPSEMTYRENGETHAFPIDFIVRGGWRSLSKNCQVPLLFIRFPEQETRGTLFEGQESLPLTTHCGRSNLLDELSSSQKYLTYEQFLLKEYLAYRLYNQISDLSLRVRLLKVRYDDPKKPGKGNTYYAFFTEHFNSLAARSNRELLPRKSFDHERLDLHLADTVALFQYMIGNTDWSIARQRNTILLQSEDGIQSPVPYDLDMAGLVNAPYAGPPPSLPITEVTQRYFLGYCHPQADWSALFSEFLSGKGDILAEVPTIPGLYKKEKSRATRYLEKFYKILNSPAKRKKSIIDACQPWPPVETDDHMAPANLAG